MKSDIVAILESIYTDASSFAAWQARLLDQCQVMDQGRGVMLASAILTDRGFVFGDVVGTSVPGLIEALRLSAADMEQKTAPFPEYRLGAAMAFGTASGKTGSMLMGPQVLDEHYGQYMHPHGVRDCIGVNALLDTNTNYGLYIPLAEMRVNPRRVVQRLSLLGVHLAAGRRRWSSKARKEAYLSPNGRVIEATPAAQRDADELSTRAKAIEAARTRKGRSDIDSVLSVWKGLVAGQWSLMEQFDTDGRRYMVARRNAPNLGRSLRLTASEERVVKLSLLGHSQKFVAYSLGLSEATVSVHLDASMLKLGVRNRAQLLAMSSILFPNDASSG